MYWLPPSIGQLSATPPPKNLISQFSDLRSDRPYFGRAPLRFVLNLFETCYLCSFGLQLASCAPIRAMRGQIFVCVWSGGRGGGDGSDRKYSGRAALPFGVKSFEMRFLCSPKNRSFNFRMCVAIGRMFGARLIRSG